jgi:hypothetical protein
MAVDPIRVSAPERLRQPAFEATGGLCRFARGGEVNVYTGWERVCEEAA